MLASAAVAAPSGSLTILYGSQTGNAKGVASAIKAQAVARGLPVTLASMADYKPKQLKKESHLLVVVSTYGEGEPPESAVDLFEQLKKGKIGKLDGLKFAVLGLGDSSYEFFCQTGKDFDNFLASAGAERIYELASLDVDYQDAAKSWGEQALNAIATTLSTGSGQQQRDQRGAAGGWPQPVQQGEPLPCPPLGQSEDHRPGFHQGYPPYRDQPRRVRADLSAWEMPSGSGSTTTPTWWGKCWP